MISRTVVLYILMLFFYWLKQLEIELYIRNKGYHSKSYIKKLEKSVPWWKRFLGFHWFKSKAAQKYIRLVILETLTINIILLVAIILYA